MHSVHLLPLVQEVLAEAGVAVPSAVAFARGPGPFTGGRIVVATAQGLGLSWECPLLPVSSLAATAYSGGEGKSAVALGAGQGEVYWATYAVSGGEVTPLTGEEVAEPTAVTVPGGEGGPWVGVGDGWASFATELTDRLGVVPTKTAPDIEPGAGAVAELGAAQWAAGGAIEPAQAVPTYLRASYAER